jgi:hypothetical protein
LKIRDACVLILLQLLSGCRVAPRDAYTPLFVHSGTESLVVPILEARYAWGESARGSNGGDSAKSSILLGRLFRDNSMAGDEAAVVLLGYYLGEADDEDLTHNLTLRGKRILPYLRGYRDRIVRLPERGRLDSLEFSTPERREFFDTVIDAIEKGEVVGVD